MIIRSNSSEISQVFPISPHSLPPSLDTKNKNNSIFQIGIILPEYHKTSFQFVRGFFTTLKKIQSCKFSLTIHTTGNVLKKIRRNIISNLTRRSYDLILSFGIKCTLAAYDFTIRQKRPPYTIFAGIRESNALDLGVINSLESSGNHLTGITVGKPPFSMQFREIFKINPSIQNVLVMYNSDNCLLNSEINAIENVCAQYKLNLETFEVNIYKDYQKALVPYLEKTDLVLTLRDNFILTHMEDIAYVCKRHNTTLCTSDWYSVDQGATMGFSFNEELIGREAAHKAFLILMQEIHPSRIPTITPPLSYSLRLEKDLERTLFWKNTSSFS